LAEYFIERIFQIKHFFIDKPLKKLIFAKSLRKRIFPNFMGCIGLQPARKLNPKLKKIRSISEIIIILKKYENGLNIRMEAIT
jgi:hypothetical protein